MTLRRITLAATLLPLLTMGVMAQTDPDKNDIFTSHVIAETSPASPPSFESCDHESVLQVQKGSWVSGPIDVKQTGAISPSIHFDKDAILIGPLRIEECDGKWRISGDLSK
jgi:hypothetical protein